MIYFLNLIRNDILIPVVGGEGGAYININSRGDVKIRNLGKFPKLIDTFPLPLDKLGPN